MSILSLRVYYYYCPETIDGLAVFSRTATGNETTSLQEVIGKCIPNASPITNGKALVFLEIMILSSCLYKTFGFKICRAILFLNGNGVVT